MCKIELLPSPVLVLLATLILLHHVARGDDLKTMIVGYNHVPPDTMNTDQGANGPGITYLQELADMMGVKSVKFEFMPLARILESLKANKIDCVARIGKKGYNIEMEYAAEPFKFSVPGLLVKNGGKVSRLASVDDLKGITIGTKIKMPLSTTMKLGGYKMHYLPGKDALPNAVKMVVSGRLDAVYSPALAELIIMAVEQGNGDKVTPLALPDDPWPVYVAFSTAGAAKFKNSYDKALAALQKVRPYSEVFREYMESFVKKHQVSSNLLSPFAKTAATKR